MKESRTSRSVPLVKRVLALEADISATAELTEDQGALLYAMSWLFAADKRSYFMIDFDKKKGGPVLVPETTSPLSSSHDRLSLLAAIGAYGRGEIMGISPTSLYMLTRPIGDFPNSIEFSDAPYPSL